MFSVALTALLLNVPRSSSKPLPETATFTQDHHVLRDLFADLPNSPLYSLEKLARKRDLHRSGCRSSKSVAARLGHLIDRAFGVETVYAQSCVWDPTCNTEDMNYVPIRNYCPDGCINAGSPISDTVWDPAEGTFGFYTSCDCTTNCGANYPPCS